MSVHDCDGRKVISWDRGRYLSMDYVCALESITYSRSLDTADLVADSAKIALEGTVFVLERFNWLDVPTGILAEEQSKLLERRRD